MKLLMLCRCGVFPWRPDSEAGACSKRVWMWKQINPGPHQQELHSQAVFSLATWRKHDLQWVNMAVRPETRRSLHAVPSGVTWGCNSSLMSGTSSLLTVQQTPPQSSTHTHVTAHTSLCEQSGNIHPESHGCVLCVLSHATQRLLHNIHNYLPDKNLQ